jgi:predicted aspartyl protease
MKLTASTFPIYLVVCASLTTLNLPTLQGESHCPGNITSVTPRMVAGALMVIPVTVNGRGPFDFMVDTGSQVTVVDPSLAQELGLKTLGTVGLVSTASYAQASSSVLDSLKAGGQAVGHSLAVVQNLGQIQAADPHIRGVLGEDFLAHFDLLIDYGRKVLCLDATGSMRDKVRGERISLVSPQHPEDELAFAQRLVVAVHLAGAGSRQVLLQLDSGSDGPILYQTRGQSRLSILDHATLRSDTASVAQRAFAALPPQDLRIGGRTLSQVPFVTPVSSENDVPNRHEDGLLPTVLFQRVFISFAGRYITIDPR